VLHSLPPTTHMPPCAPLHPELKAPTPSQVLTNTALHTRHQITLPQSHSHRYLYATLAPLCTPALKPHTCMTRSACGLAFLWGLKPVSPLYFFFALLFFFQSCAFAHPFNMHLNTVLACPHPHLARRQNSGAIARSR